MLDVSKWKVNQINHVTELTGQLIRFFSGETTSLLNNPIAVP